MEKLENYGHSLKKMWKVQDSRTMSHLTDMFSYRIPSPENVGTDYTIYVDSIEAIETQYPDDVNSRLWRDIKTHKYVQALKEFEE